MVWEAKATGCRSARPSGALSVETGCPAPPRLPDCHGLSGDISSWKMPWWLLLTLSLPTLLQPLSTQRGRGDTSQAPAPSVISACEWPGRWASWSAVPGASSRLLDERLPVCKRPRGVGPAVAASAQPSLRPALGCRVQEKRNMALLPQTTEAGLFITPNLFCAPSFHGSRLVPSRRCQ